MAWNMHLLWTYILNTFHCCYRALLKALCLLSTAEIDWNIPCLSLIWFDGQFHYDLSQSLVYAYVCVFACVCVCVCVCATNLPSAHTSSCKQDDVPAMQSVHTGKTILLRQVPAKGFSNLPFWIQKHTVADNAKW